MAASCARCPGYLIVACLFLVPPSVLAQPRQSVSDTIRSRLMVPAAGDSLNDWNYSVGDSSVFDLSCILPAVFKDDTALKRYIQDPRFLFLRRIAGDTAAVDAIFLRAMEIADQKIDHALLIAALATFDHFRLGVKLPVIGTVFVPLTLESNSSYRLRFSHLPRHVLPDSQGVRKRDKDKMQHFFGSAYLTYVFDSKAVAEALGDFIEWAEPKFIVGGDFDARDKYANRLGQEFGMRLLDGEDVSPSDILWGGRVWQGK